MTEVKLLVLYDAGHYGNFIRTFLEKFSKLTPPLEGDAFNTDGRSHGYRKISWSGKFKRKHFFHYDEVPAGQNILMVRPVSKFGYFFHKTLAWHRTFFPYRQANPNFSIDDLWKSTLDQDSPLIDMENDLKSYYGLDSQDKPTKYFVRDWFKQEFLSSAKSFDQKKFDELEQKFNGGQTFIFPLEAMTSKESFIDVIKDVNGRFELELDFSMKEEMGMMFDKGFSLDNERINLKKVLDICDNISNNIDAPIGKLNVVLEAFIQAEVEKNNPGFVFPMHNHFYETTGEILRLIKYFPNYYKMKNPHIKDGDLA